MTLGQLLLAKKGHESSSNGQSVQRVEENEVRKGLMLLGLLQGWSEQLSWERGVGNG